MLRGAIAHDQAASQLHEFIEARLMKGVSVHLRDDHDSFDSIVATAAQTSQALLEPGFSCEGPM